MTPLNPALEEQLGKTLQLTRMQSSIGQSMKKVNMLNKIGALLLKNPALANLAKKGKIDINMKDMKIRTKDGKELTEKDLQCMGDPENASIASHGDRGEVDEVGGCVDLVLSKQFIPMLNRDKMYELEDSYCYTDQSSASGDE